MDKINNLLDNLYYKQQNYDGVDGLYKKAKLIEKSITRASIKDWLNKQNTKQITTKKTDKKMFLPIYSETPYSFQIDLTFFPRYKKQNKNLTYYSPLSMSIRDTLTPITVRIKRWTPF